MKEYYSQLYLKEGASIEEVKTAYRKLAKKFHPDKNIESNDFEEEFKLIQNAYEKLMAHFAGQQFKTENKTQNSKSTAGNYNRDNNSETKTKKEEDSKSKTETSNKDNITEKYDYTSQKYQEHCFDTFSYKVDGLFYSKTLGKGYAKQVADGIYLVIKLSITNITNKTESFDYTMPKLIDIDNYQYKTSVNGSDSLLLSGTRIFGRHSIDCHPKISTIGFIVFEVPKINEYSLILSSTWQTETIPLLNIKTLSNIEDQKEEVIFNEASFRQEKGTAKFICGICKTVFYADRAKSSIVICPHCKTKNSLPIIKGGCTSIFALIFIMISSLLLFLLFVIY